MKFLIQKNLIDRDDLLKVESSIKSYPKIFIDVIPFDTKIKSDEKLIGKDYLPYGSTLLTNLTYLKKYKGVFFDLNTFNYSAFIQNRDDMLNDNIMKIENAIEFLNTKTKNDLFFVRPSADLKQFTGTVENAKDIREWFKDMMECASSGNYKIEKGTDVVVSEPKNILSEYRFFVIKGEVIDGSMYRYRDQLNSVQINETDLLIKAQKLADKWLPNETCVMDLALMYDNSLKVIEFNCLNSSGFYANNINKIFKNLFKNYF